jgi:hypothetical protein
MVLDLGHLEQPGALVVGNDYAAVGRLMAKFRCDLARMPGTIWPNHGSRFGSPEQSMEFTWSVVAIIWSLSMQHSPCSHHGALFSAGKSNGNTASAVRTQR